MQDNRPSPISVQPPHPQPSPKMSAPKPSPGSSLSRSNTRSVFGSPLSSIEESDDVVQNLNDSFASVASDFGHSPIRAGPGPNTSPPLPSSPSELKRMIRAQRDSMNLAGQYGSELVSELEQAHAANAALRKQIDDLTNETTSASSQVASLRALSDFLRTEANAFNASDRVGGTIPQVQLAGTIPTDLGAFQTILRAQRKAAREIEAKLLDEVDQLKHTVSSQQANITNLTAQATMWQTLQAQHHELQQAHDELEISNMEWQTKLKIQSSQLQTMNQMWKEQVHNLKEEHQEELIKLQEMEASRRETLEKQAKTLKAQMLKLKSIAAAATAENAHAALLAAAFEVDQHAESSSTNTSMNDSTNIDLDITVTSSAGEMRSHKSAKRVSLSHDLNDTDDHDESRQDEGAPAIISPASFQQPGEPEDTAEHHLTRLARHLDTLMTTESDRHSTRSGWHEAETLWFFERARLREVEQEALAVRKDELEAERTAWSKLYEHKTAHELVETLREQLRQSLERESNLRDGQEKVLSSALERMTQSLEAKEEELCVLRDRLDHLQASSVNAVPSTPLSKHAVTQPATPADTLSTPILKASRDIPSARRFTPPTHQRQVETNMQSAASPVSTSQVAPAPASSSPILSTSATAIDTRLMSGIKETNDLTTTVLKEVKGSNRSMKSFISFVFILQSFFVLVWFILTNGGTVTLADQPIIQMIFALFEDGSGTAHTRLFQA